MDLTFSLHPSNETHGHLDRPFGSRSSNRTAISREPAHRIVAVGLGLIAILACASLARAQSLTDSVLYARLVAFQEADESDSLLVYADALIASASTTGSPTSEADGLLFRGRALEGLRRYDESLDAMLQAAAVYETVGNKESQAEASFSAALLLIREDRYRQAIEYLRPARSQFLSTDNLSRAAQSTTHIGLSLDYLGQYDSALTYYQSALEQFRVLEDSSWIARNLTNSGVMYDLMGDYEEAAAYYQQGFEVYEAIGDKRGAAASLNNLGIVYRIQGRLAEATSNYLRSLAMREELGERGEIATSLNNIGVLLELQGNYESALSYLERSLAIKEELGNQRGIAATVENIGKIASNQGRYDEALALYERSLSINEDIEDQNGIASALSGMSHVYLNKGDYDAALSRLDRALELKRTVGDRKGEASALVGIGTVYLAEGALEEALAFFRRALAIDEDTGNRSGIATANSNIGGVHAARGDYDRALVFHTRALEIREDISEKKGIGVSLASIGDVHLALEEYASAEVNYRRALEIDRQLGDLRGFATRYSSLADVNVELEQFDRALGMTDDALAVADTIRAIGLIRDIHEQRARIYERAGNTSAALESYKLFKSANDSLFTANSRAVIAEIQERFRTREQTQRISSLLQDRRNQRRVLSGLVVGILIIAALALFAYSSFRNKRRAFAELDVTHARLKSAQQRLVHQEKMASLGQLTAGIAHELKNPLNFVNNFSVLNGEMLAELEELADSDDEDVRELLESLKGNATMVLEHGTRANNIVTSMMQHAAGQATERVTTDISSLVDEHVNLSLHAWHGRNPDHAVQVTRAYDDAPLDVEVNPREIGRVIVNLVNNALDAIATSDSESLLRVSTKRTDHAIEIQIADNGSGMDSDTAARVFEPFFTTKPTGSGTGLGLSLSYDIVVTGHGGSIVVESQPGEGAMFTIELPLDER